MKRMKLCRYLVLSILIVLFVVTSASGWAEAKYNWKLASVLPETHPVHKALVFFAAKVFEKSHGAIQITIYPAGKLGGETDYIQAHKKGTIEISKVSAAVVGQFSKSMQVVSLPFIWRDLNHQHKVLDGKIGKQLMDDVYRSGFKGLAFLDAGFRSISTRERPIYSPADLKGMKIRVMQSKPLITTINAMGATAIPMSQNEVYIALQQKTIDGWENNQPTVLSFNMQEVCKYYSYTCHSSIPDFLIMRKETYDRLPRQLQKAVDDAAHEMIPLQRKIWDDYKNDAVKELAAKGMIFNEVKNIKDFQALAKPVYKDYEPIVGANLMKAVENTK